MNQSTLQTLPAGGLHVAIIMDGNGRWARARGRTRTWGHREGAKVARKIVEAAPSHGISVLTLYAFSSDNWRRPAREVAALMRLFETYLRGEVRKSVDVRPLHGLSDLTLYALSSDNRRRPARGVATLIRLFET